MLLTEEQVEERLNSERNLANRFSRSHDGNVVEIPIERPGKNRPNLTEETRTEISIRARLGETQVSIAKDLGINQSTVSHIETGRITKIDEARRDQAVNEVKDKALNRLMASLGLLTDDKLSGCSAKDLSVIASNMGRVVEKTSPREVSEEKINLIIYAPELRTEKSFKTIEV